MNALAGCNEVKGRAGRKESNVALRTGAAVPTGCSFCRCREVALLACNMKSLCDVRVSIMFSRISRLGYGR